MRLRLTILLFTMFVISAGLWGADNPLIGTWKQNPAKSKNNVGPQSQSSVNKYELAGPGDCVKVTTNAVSAQGEKTGTQYTGCYNDGKDHPVMDTVAGKPSGDTTLKRIDTYTTERTIKWKTGGTQTIRLVVSKDGKTLTTTAKGVGAQGQPVDSVSVWDKQ